MARDRMQVERAVRLVAMEVDSHANDRDVRHYERVQRNLPPRPAQQAVGNEIKH
jgi:hypothetical protein